ncbi:DDE-domain-containing protein [Viridothelium virens]|uniref:DDE-domain-containing protein n=1 Tax=Viridothelium virens TaxID=1048519 RepID=A0A6A6GS45_VIRVR|nr:DDE-domain-containing protein [Viridothelium virens]
MKRVFSKKAYKCGLLKGAGVNGARTWVTVLASVSILQDFDAEKHDCAFASSPLGWTNNEIGFRWLTEVFNKRTKITAQKGRDIRLLIIDGHSSHVDKAFLEYCDAHQILVAVFPPHSTHQLQPLNVSLFSPLATYYSQNLNNWLAKFQALPAFKKAFSPSNIKSAWRKTGLRPFDPSIILKQLSTQLEELNNNASSSALSTHLS